MRRRGRRRSIVLVSLLVCLAVAGCARRDSTDNRPGGFYGGVSAGTAVP